MNPKHCNIHTQTYIKKVTPISLDALYICDQVSIKPSN